MEKIEMMGEEIADALDELDDEILDENEETENISERSTIMQKYMRDISKFKTLSREEEIDIFIEYQRGEPGKKQEIINCNLKLVVYLANKKFSHLFNIVNPMDLIQEGNLGMMNSIDKFNLSYGNRFSTYSSQSIINSMILFIMNNSSNIILPIGIKREIIKYKKIKRSLYHELGRRPFTEEIGINMNKKICEILDIELNIMLEKISSLDAAINLSEDNKYSLYDALPTCETQGVEYKINIDDTNDAVKSALMNLTEKERLLIMSQFGFLKEELSKEELSKRTSIHKDKINNVTSRIINKLRDMDCLKINT